MASAFKKFTKNWYDPAVLPIIGVIGGALVGVGYYLTRLAADPNNVYSNKNPYPWNEIKPTDTPRKFLLPNKEKYEKLKETSTSL